MTIPVPRRLINWVNYSRGTSSYSHLPTSTLAEEEIFDGDTFSKIEPSSDAMQMTRKPNYGITSPATANQRPLPNGRPYSVHTSHALNNGYSEDGIIDAMERPRNWGPTSFESTLRTDNEPVMLDFCRSDLPVRHSNRSITFAQPMPTYLPDPKMRASYASSRRRPLVNVLDSEISQGSAGSGTFAPLANIDGEQTIQASSDRLSVLPETLRRDSESVDLPSKLTDRDFSVSRLSNASARSVISGSTILFQNIEYVVPVRRTPCSKKRKKIVLDGVSGIMRPGLNAIMGPTGCGKSSLLDTLAGRKDPKYISGKVLIDGQPQPKNFKCISGYVVQDDILMGTLTVRETLYMAAMLRRKRGYSKLETAAKVNEILDELGLTAIADSKIGNELIRGISGGERKRTSIGMEIISDPSVLFLDEPTTGLDAFTACSVIQTLKALSLKGRTIVLSIHQPKYSIYKLFDSLTLITSGKMVYHGSALRTPIEYFTRLGYICEEHNNPPDFFLDVLHGEVKVMDPEAAHSGEDVISNPVVAFAHVDGFDQMKEASERLITAWNESPENQEVQNEVLAVTSDLSNAATTSTKPKVISYAAPFCRQFRIICWRTTLSLIRDPQASIVQTLVYLFFAVSMGVVYFGLDTSLEAGIQNRAGLFFFASLQVVFVNIGSIELFIKERAIFIHEHSSGYYRVSTYFLAKLICDVFPTKALPVFFFMPITYWMVGLVPYAGNFFFFELMLTLGTVSAAAAGICVSAAVTLFSLANVLISILFVFMMVFGGFLINLNSMVAWLSWLRYFSIFYYTIGGLLVNEMSGLVFCPTSNSTVTSSGSRSCESGIQYLSDLGFAYGSSWALWLNVLGLIVISVIFFTVCYLLLRGIKTYK